MARRDHRLILAFALAALATLPYANSIRNGFTFDDVPLVAENPRLRTAAGVASLAVTDWWGGTRPMSRLYRPLTMGTFAADYVLARPGLPQPVPKRLPDAAAVPFHVQNVLWHAAATALLFLLLFEWFGSLALAAFAAALFAVHPVHAEAVNGIVGRAELMAAAFSFGALLAASRSRPVAAGVLLLAGLASKEQAIAVPAIALVRLAFVDADERRRWIASVPQRRVFIAFGVAIGLYLTARVAVLGSLTGAVATTAGTIVVDNPIAGASGLARVATPVRVFSEVLRLLVFPRTLSADYSFDQIPLVSSPDLATLAGAVAMLGLAVCAVMFRRRLPAACFGVAFFFAAWALTSNLVVITGTILGERLLYLPSAGACLAIAALIIAGAARLRSPRVATAVVALLVVAAAGRTWARNRDWKDNTALFTSTVATSPRSCKAANGLASELLASGRLDDARRFAERALSIYPRYAEAHANLAKIDRAVALAEHDNATKAALRVQAEEHARTALAVDPGNADSWNTLAALALDRGDVDAAEAGYREALARDASYGPAINGLGVALSHRAESERDPGRRAELQKAAAAQFDRALALDPADPQAAQNAATLRALLAGEVSAGSGAGAETLGAAGERLMAQGRFDEALASYREAARLEPSTARAFLGIGGALAALAERASSPAQRQELLDAAIAAFTHALTLEPDNPAAHMNLGVTLIRSRREPAQVAEHFRAYLRLVPGAPNRAQMEQTIRDMDALASRKR